MSWFNSLWPSSTKAPSSAPVEPIIPPPRILEEKPAAVAATPAPQSQTDLRELDNRNRSRVIFGAGVAFFAVSLLITRRSLTRRRLKAPFYTNAPGHNAQLASNVSAPLEAVEALSIATVNVLSVTMMATGGALWYLDINSMADARKLIRGGLGVDGTGRSEKDAEEDFEEWMATTLARKDAKASKQQSNVPDKD